MTIEARDADLSPLEPSVCSFFLFLSYSTNFLNDFIDRAAHRAVHRQLVTVMVLVPSGFSYLFFIINQTKLFKRQEVDNELNDRKTWMQRQPSQPP